MISNLLSGALGAFVISLFVFFLTKTNEKNQLKRQKAEQAFILLQDVLISLDNIQRVQENESHIMPHYKDNPGLSFHNDIVNVQNKTVYAGAIIKAYLGSIQVFNQAYKSLFDKDGYCQEKLRFGKTIKVDANTGSFSYSESRDEHIKKCISLVTKIQNEIMETNVILVEKIAIRDITIKSTWEFTKKSITFLFNAAITIEDTEFR